MAQKFKRYTNPFLKVKGQSATPAVSEVTTLQLAISLHEQGKLAQAQSIYLQLLELDARNADALHLLGVVAYQTGQYQGSVDMIGRAIGINSSVASYHSNLGLALHELKQFNAAVVSYDRAINLDPTYALAYSNGGNALLELNRVNEALASYDKAIVLDPNYVQAYYNQGNALLELKKFAEAVVSYDKAIALKPDYAEAYCNRGNALQALKQLDSAVASYDRAIALKPDYAEAYVNRGNALQALEQIETAIASYDKAIALKPDYAEAYSNRGNALQAFKQIDAALASFDMAIALNPDYAEAYSNRGNALQELKKFTAAINNYDQALALKPDYADAFANRGNSLQSLKQFDAAIGSYNKAIDLQPDLAEVYSVRGNALQELGQLNCAVASYDLAIAQKPEMAEAHYNRGITLQTLKLFDEALDSYDKAFDLNPEIEFLLSIRQHARMFLCDWSNISQSLADCETAIVNNKLFTPFVALTLFDNPELHFLCSKFSINSKHPTSKVLGPIAKRTPTDRIRLGYFSADLYYHPVATWLVEQLENHDKSQFELFAFVYRPDKKDPMSTRLQAAFDHYIEVDKMSDLEVAQLSRQLGIDIAIDLGGHTAGNRTDIFAARAAPIQVSHLGFPGSMGADYIDYVIFDAHSLPESAAKYYSEKIAYVPCVYTYDRQRQISAEPLSRAQFGLPEKGFVFTCQNGCQKIMPEVFGVWMEILQAVPESVLWLLEPHHSAKQNLINEAQARGIESERLVFTQRETVAPEQESARIARYLASYKLADLFLDTWPYNAGSTAVDALWAGLPVLTKAGVVASARMALSALQAIEVPELITYSAQEYQDLAVELASDSQKLKLITDKLQKNRLTSALFDPVGNTRHIEAAYTKMYERYQADLPKEHLRISA
jgi:predicted O-linked N-acetylglucosamine transferase (SPINDLY family)